MVKLNPKFSIARSKVAAKKIKPAALPHQEVVLEISLLHIKPRIWREFAVPADIRLERLHNVLQVVMGWTDSHLHSFRNEIHEYVQADPDGEWKHMAGSTLLHDEKKHTLRDLVTAKGDKFFYLYDFGDDWEHMVRARAIGSTLKRTKFAHCLRGSRACPPEDCGGPYAYEELCQALPDPKHPEHRHWKEWIGNYNPRHFDVDDVNFALSVVRV